MKSDLLIKNGFLVSSTTTTKANVHIKDGKVLCITETSIEGQPDKVIDAEGLYVIPGLVDPHVHMMDPGHTDREDFITGTKAAAAGGVTTVIEHHRTEPPVVSRVELNDKINYLNGRAVTDFCLMGGIAPDNIDKLEGMWADGAVSFKMFTCGLHGQPAMLPGNMLEAFRKLASLKAQVLIHCEDDTLTNMGEEFFKQAGRTDYLSHYEWRSVEAEEIAISAVIPLAKSTGAKVIIAHTSSPHLLDKIKAARDEGYPIYTESCPHYFHLSTDDLAKKGPWVKFAPSVRKPEVLPQMWQRLDAGFISYIGSDHCPFPKAVKQPGEANIWDAPNGIPGVETGLKLMLTGVNQGMTTLNRVVEVMCENPAKIYNIFPQKGTIAIGADADIVLVDMNKEEVLSNDNIVSKCGWTPYDGKKVKGVPKHVFLRGQQIVTDGKVIGQAGAGKFIPRLT